MKQILLMVAVTVISVVGAFGQAKVDAAATKAYRKAISDIEKEQHNPVNSLLSASDVGEPDSFGKAVKFLGTAVTGEVFVEPSCDPVVLADAGIVLGPDDRCVVSTVPGGRGNNVFLDLGRINIPGRSADNVIYFVLNTTVSAQLANETLSTQNVFSLFAPRITIESSALNDPAAVDPVSGMPLNGVLTVSGFGSKVFQRSVAPNVSDFFIDASSASATRGFARGYFADLGLPQSVINNLYRQPMTIKFGMRVDIQNLYAGQYLYTVRLMGN